MRTEQAHQVVVVGGGYAGTLAAIRLAGRVRIAGSDHTQLPFDRVIYTTGSAVDRASVPGAIVSLLGRWNWWLPRVPARRLRVPPSLPRPARFAR
jgi:uncharacterized membrane protein YdfJ with MMPL/SSD domain